ncbi:MAG: GTP-binding protein [Candidatus Njordarchaeota archaeon]
MLLADASRIRNVGVAGHIDHGKTTLADHILAEAGIIAKELAGKVRYLDFWLEEQKRGITMKTTVMSFFIKDKNKKFLIHLCDTPGHVDFSGKVSRAFRLVDSAIFVVDAVEGIMAQTESYLRLALNEAVMPILFVNKIDRLITELKAEEYQIFSRISAIIRRFNAIIRRYSPKNVEWEINPNKNNVAFGSALHGWGFTFAQANAMKIKFGDIIEMYRNNDLSSLKKMFPLGKALTEFLVGVCPNPLESQRVRIKHIWSGSRIKALEKCTNNSETIFYVSKVSVEKGRIFVTARVFSGEVKIGEYIRLNEGIKKKVRALFVLKASKHERIDAVPAGNIFGAYLEARPGDTFASIYVDGFFRQPTYLAYPVLAVAVEPKNFSDFRKLDDLLRILTIEDPNMIMEISKETGQFLIYGIGELHLETIIKRIADVVPIYYSEPIVAFREIIAEDIEDVSDYLVISVKPIIDMDREDVFSVVSNKVEVKGLSLEKRRAIETILRESLKNGPRIGEPIIGVSILVEIRQEVSEEEVLGRVSQVLARIKTKIAQPFYKFSISADCEYLGAVIGELSARGAKIDTLEKGDICEIEGIVSVIDSLGLTTKMRNLTHGKASVQLEFIGFKIASGSEEDRIFRYISSRSRTYQEAG